MDQKLVLHVDCDCFYASVEMAERPELRSVPLAIGGMPDQRGVVATCNYPARFFGVRSAMSTAKAIRLCPSLVTLPPNMSKYRQVSAEIMDILKEYAVRFEQVSIDEAYLELSPHASGWNVAEDIQKRIRLALGVSVSVGVAPNRFLSKIASGWNKPEGIFQITPAQVQVFVDQLPVGCIPGVGPKLEQSLFTLGLKTGLDLKSWSLPELIHRFGKMGAVLHDRCRGIDSRKIGEERARKSASVEKTFATDLVNTESAMTALPELWDRLQQRIRESETMSSVSFSPFVKLKFSDFSQTTLSDSQRPLAYQELESLLALAWQRENKPVRLIGIGGRVVSGHAAQGQLF